MNISPYTDGVRERDRDTRERSISSLAGTVFLAVPSLDLLRPIHDVGSCLFSVILHRPLSKPSKTANSYPKCRLPSLRSCPQPSEPGAQVIHSVATLPPHCFPGTMGQMQTESNFAPRSPTTRTLCLWQPWGLGTEVL